MLTTPVAVALVGKLGHGKTFLLNKLTRSNFASNMGAQSCTRTLQYDYSRQHGILVVDTPGFCASDDVAAHIAAQKLALEGIKLSGVYIVIKFGRSDELAEMVSKIMSFIGDDDIRIIITWSDSAEQEVGYDPRSTKTRLFELLDVPIENITVVGKDTDGATIEDFITATLHEPKNFQISDEQVTSISSLCSGARKFNKAIDEVYAKIAAASKSCAELTKKSKSYETDTAITTIQHSTAEMVKASKEKIFVDAAELTDEQQNLIYGKAGLALALRLKTFEEASNKLLTWDVTNPSDQRNVYKKCNYCGAVFNKTEGCDGRTVCGSVPADTKRSRPMLVAQFKAGVAGWFVQYFWDGKEIQVQYILATLADFFHRNTQTWGGDHLHEKREGADIESGCGAGISWSTMLPVDPELVLSLGEVEIQSPGRFEEESKASFEDRLHQHELKNKRILDGAFAHNK